MKKKAIFISHSSKDDGFVKELRQYLEALQLDVWADSRKLAGGDVLEAEIKDAIQNARAFILVLSRDTFNSAWVLKETRAALKVKKNQGDAYRVIPLLLPGVEPAALGLYLQEEPVGVRVGVGPGGVVEALPAIMAALGERLPDDNQLSISVEQNKSFSGVRTGGAVFQKSPLVAEDINSTLNELVLELVDPVMTLADGIRRAGATARLIFYPGEKGLRDVESERFSFTAAMGPIERDDLSWYLERFAQWPIGVFKDRAEKVVKLLPQWGQALFKAVFHDAAVRNVLMAWEKSGGAGGAGDRRFTVYVNSSLVNAEAGKQAEANEAGALLLGLPWELLHDGRSYLFQGGQPVQVRRRLPNRVSVERRVSQPPIRVLLVSPRPEDDAAGYMDHRVSALPLVTALESLGDLVELTVLAPPTFRAMQGELDRAHKKGVPYHVVHFDGHGVFSKKTGLGGLCFEDPQDSAKLEARKSELVDAQKIAEVFKAHRVSLVFLDACQSAKSEDDPTASVAARLLDEGVAAVVAMSHSVLVETAKRFVESFYGELATGSRVGEAMLAGHKALYGDAYRGKVFGAGKLYMQDWFTPVLYQEREDLRLLTCAFSRGAEEINTRVLENRFGNLPGTPGHSFVGRSRELLKLERLLALESFAVVCGQGGEGKTTLAVELARWLVRSRRFGRAVFVSLEDVYDVRTVVDRIGRQLVSNYSVAEYKDDELLSKALQPIERELRNHRTMIVLDNMETILPPPKIDKSFHGGDRGAAFSKGAPLERFDSESLQSFFKLCQKLLKIGETRVLFTSREALPEPFAAKLRHVVLGRLTKNDAVELVQRAMTAAGITPKEDERGGAQPEVEALVEAVNGHARGLVLLAPYIGEFGVGQTTERLGQLMAELDKEYPNERERSLFASVELSLQRLSPHVREKIQPLGVFQGGGNIVTIGLVLELNEEEILLLAAELMQTGLAVPMGYGFYRFDPALCPYLRLGMDEVALEKSTARWIESMRQLSVFLYKQHFQNAQVSATLTLLELPNLMVLLDLVRAQGDAEKTVDLATSLEQLIAPLGRSHLLARVVAIREEEVKKLEQGGWSHTRFVSAKAQIERLLGKGNFPQALQEAQGLLEKCRRAGEDAYKEALYDTAMAYILLGRILKMGGASQAALPLIEEAYTRFQRLAGQGRTDAACMASACLTEKGDCLLFLGRYEEAAAAYEEGIQLSVKLKNERGVAVGKGQLGTVRMKQGHYADALGAYAEAIKIFTELGEPATVAIYLHQTGMVHEEAGQWEAAEQAYRQAQAIEVQHHNPAGEASTLNQLGNLYQKMDRLEEAVIFFRQAADKSVEIGDMAKEGLRRNNLANTLIKLKRYNQARTEILRAIECKEPYGHAALPWTSYNILCDLERAEGNAEAAQAAREQAMQLYLAYRRDGGENQTGAGRLCLAVGQAIKANQTAEVAAALEERLKQPGISSLMKTFIPKLQAILAGSRDPGLADDPELWFMDAVEVRRLMEEMQ
ncbi:MAG: TIR domain-containing protein [Candidatus Aminicenantes bacterium]|nr:TIR domain-containing protein [Candidatus Aminicenantes bacterium]